MSELKIYSTRREYWLYSLKEHWIIWTTVSTFIAIASFLKFDATQEVSGWVFYLLLFITFGYLTLSSIAFSASVKAVKSFVHKKEFSPSFQKMTHVSLIEGTNNYRVIAIPPPGMRVPVNTLVCVYNKSEYQQVIGLGKITKENDDCSVELTVSTSEGASDLWNNLLKEKGFEEIIITVLVPKEVIPDIDGYLNSENISIQQLLKSTSINTDGGDVKI